MEGLTCPECHLTFFRKDAMLRHKRNKPGTTQPYPQSTYAYPPPQKGIIQTPPQKGIIPLPPPP